MCETAPVRPVGARAEGKISKCASHVPNLDILASHRRCVSSSRVSLLRPVLLLSWQTYRVEHVQTVRLSTHCEPLGLSQNTRAVSAHGAFSKSSAQPGLKGTDRTERECFTLKSMPTVAAVKSGSNSSSQYRVSTMFRTALSARRDPARERFRQVSGLVLTSRLPSPRWPDQ